jgi:hypothetical protein
MTEIGIHPLLLFAASFFVLALFAWLGVAWRSRYQGPEPAAREGFNLVIGATLTLLGLLIGFTFSMALGRYDLRKTYEEEEANAIGTEFRRADLLPSAHAAKVRELLIGYLDQRILFYTTKDKEKLREINNKTGKLQDDLWSAILPQALAQPNAVITLTVAGMNDVFNAQGYTQAAWWNRIPLAAWSLMAAMAFFASTLIGFASGKTRAIWILPLMISIAFFLIAEIDAPRRGLIRVVPENLRSLSESLHGQESSPVR